MPKPRKPTALLELTGAFKKNPHRAVERAGDALPKGDLGAEVESLTPLASACWKRIVEIAAPGVLKNSDEPIVELAARLWAKVKTGEATATESALLAKCLQQMGMTPVARSMVQVPQNENDNEFVRAHNEMRAIRAELAEECRVRNEQTNQGAR